MRVLLVEYDQNTPGTAEETLRRAGMNVHATAEGQDGIDLAKHYEFDLIVLDLHLPDLSGRRVLRELRRSKVTTPILILAEANDSENKVWCLSAGADDYMTKPCDEAELIARIRAIVRRSRGHSHAIIEVGPLEVNLDTRTAKVHGDTLKLSEKEYQILEMLSLRVGTPLTKEMFLNGLYGGMDEPEPKIIDVFVCKLRKKLEAAMQGQRYIQTIWGHGYVLQDPAAVEAGM